jgi:hypothetical protein
MNTSPNTPVTLELKLTADHVHGPGCGHDHHPKAFATNAKYKEPRDVPAMDVLATFATNKGPNWRKNPAAVIEAMFARIAMVPENETLVIFINVQLYTWLFSAPEFKKRYRPSVTTLAVETGVFGMLSDRTLIMTDALLDPSEQVTMKNAFYYCTEVLAQPQEAQDGPTV